MAAGHILMGAITLAVRKVALVIRKEMTGDKEVPDGRIDGRKTK